MMNINIKTILIIMILCILEIAALIIYLGKYISNYSFKSFMEKLSEKLDYSSESDQKYLRVFEDVFNKYTDSTGLFALGNFFTMAIVLVAIGILLLFTILIQLKVFCRQDDSKRFIFSLIFIILCFAINFANLDPAFNAKYEVKLDKDQIYRFDDEFNEEIKDNLDFMYERRIYLIVCFLLTQIFFICQIVLVIIKDKIIKKEDVLINKKECFEKDIGLGNFKEMEGN